MASQLELTEDDVPGARLEEPLESATMPALRRWLLCRGIQVSTSVKKSKLIEKIRDANKGGLKVIDVDGSCLYKKIQQQGGIWSTDNDTVPDIPLSGWETIDASSYKEMSKKIPRVTHGLMYSYLAEGVGRSDSSGAFRSLKQGFKHWASGRLTYLEINVRHPFFCHVRSKMTPSMKQGIYNVYILFGSESGVATMKKASCECAAGKSASCTHVSGLLHALVNLTPINFQDIVGMASPGDDDEAIPVTSLECQWKRPRKRKESNLKIAEATFQKHVYGREQKREFQSLTDFDPRPSELRGNATDQMHSFLQKVKGKALGVSLLFDSDCRCWSTTSGCTANALSPQLPSKEELKERVDRLKDSLNMPTQKMREIEQNTRDQSHSSLWHSVRRYRISASHFGAICRRLPTTPPQSLVLQILQPKKFSSAATDWGIRHEEIALKKYCDQQHQCGHHGLYYCKSGFVISKDHPFLGASPDAVVHDPTSINQFGLAEVKSPYSCRHLSPLDAAESTNFCSRVEVDSSGKKYLKLKQTHIYYSQIQGQMAITEGNWCDFIIYTEKGVSVERIPFDADFWNNKLLPKLTDFFDNCLAPEIVSPIHALGIPVRNLRDM